MTAPPSWQEQNAQQLGAALAELRQRLENFPRPAVPETETPAKHVETIVSSTDEPTAKAPSAMERLGERLGLSSFERNVLLLCAAMELDTRTAGLCARAQDDPQKNFPTFALALALFDEPSWEALSPERPLRFWRLIEISQLGAQPLTASALRADERMVNYLKGLNQLDERLASLVSPVEFSTGAAELAAAQQQLVQIILRRWRQSAETGLLPVAQLVGADPQSKQLVAQQTAATLHRRLYRLPVESLPTNPSELEWLARLWQRESRLLPLALYLDADESSNSAEHAGALNRFLSRSDGVFFLGTRENLPQVGSPHFALDITKPTAAEQKGAWTAALGEDAHDTPAQLAGQFNLNLPRIHELARVAKLEARDSNRPLTENIWEICRAGEPHVALAHGDCGIVCVGEPGAAKA